MVKKQGQQVGNQLGKQPVHYPMFISMAIGLITALLFAYSAPSSTAAFFPSNIVRGLASTNPIVLPESATSTQILLPSPAHDSSAFAQNQIFVNKVISTWGSETSPNNPDLQINYTTDLQSRGIVNFKDGLVTIETIDGTLGIERLREAIIVTMQLASTNQDGDKGSTLTVADSLSFLYEDNPELSGKLLDWQADANALAEMLVNNCKVTRNAVINGEEKTILAVTVPLRSAKAKMRAESYKEHVGTYSKKYDITSALILAIMHTESNFNPHAVSTSKALGLMQVVPETAGQEVNAFLTGNNTPPSIASLLSPENNIKFGTTYIHILNRQYFGKVTDKTSRKLCTIAAYNAGPGAVLRTFSKAGDPIENINKMTSAEVYTTLITKMPSSETRRYVEVVTKHLGTYAGNS